MITVSINRCSLDELQIHGFFKFQKRLSRDRNSLHSDMVKLLETYEKKRPINKEINHLEETLCSKYKAHILARA